MCAYLDMYLPWCCKEKITSPPNEWRNIPLIYLTFFSIKGPLKVFYFWRIENFLKKIFETIQNMPICKLIFLLNKTSIVGCQGEVQPWGPNPWYNQGGRTKAYKSFLFTESSLVV